MRRRVLASTAWHCAVFVLVAACRGERATAEDCQAIFDRIVELELGEMGYRDPVLAERKRAELGQKLAAEIARCEGRKLDPAARACIAAATHAEDVVHRCLR